MFPLKGIREHLSSRLDTEIGVLRKHRNSQLIISESPKDDRDKAKHGEHLEEITIVNIPIGEVWIFENEFMDKKKLEKNAGMTVNSALIGKGGQSGAFTSSGSKVETSILYHNGKRLYLVMVEMKRAISPQRYHTDIVFKFESSLATLSVFLSAHFDFPTFEDTKIYPIGVCCYNTYEDKDPTFYRDPKSLAGKFRNKYAEDKRELLLEVSPLSLNRMTIPVLLFENPNMPKTKAFELDFNEIIRKVEAI